MWTDDFVKKTNSLHYQEIETFTLLEQWGKWAKSAKGQKLVQMGRSLRRFVNNVNAW